MSGRDEVWCGVGFVFELSIRVGVLMRTLESCVRRGGVRHGKH